MFSGTYPFDDIANDFKVMFAIQQGRRPSPPSHDLSRVRGWNHEILHLIEACWTEKPSERLSAGDIVERLRALPNRPIDERPLDKFNTSFAAQVLRNHPFSMLVTSTKATKIHGRSWMLLTTVWCKLVLDFNLVPMSCFYYTCLASLRRSGISNQTRC
jgi:hypothetical protein